MGTTGGSHPREREVYLEVLDLESSDEQERRLDDLCGDDNHLRERVERLLRIEERTGLFEPDSVVREVFDGLVGAESPPSSPRLGWQPPSPAELDVLLQAYRVEELIGKGGMGAVYRGTQVSLGRPVAIKILPPEFAEDRAFAERFRREALAMAKLEHPNLVTIHYFGHVEPYFFIVMDLIEGTNLHQVIARGGLEPSAVPGIIHQICDALQYAHDHGYVHRDIKPANIFLTRGGQVKVGDFGLAKLAGADDVHETQLTLTGYQIGTPNYMAPETLSPGEVDHRADIYSLGVLFYEMLTGNVPKGVFGPPSQKVRIDSRLDEVVLKAMREEPGERYQQASEVKTDLDAITSTKARPGRRSQGSPSGRLNSLLWTGAGAILAGAGFWLAPVLEEIAVPEPTLVSLEDRVNADGSDAGAYASTTLVDGRPAISYYDSTFNTLNYVIADDPAATGWGPVRKVGAFSAIRCLSLASINGRPAISYRQSGTGPSFAIADDASGSRWQVKRIATKSSDIRSTSLALVNGVPAIAFVDVQERPVLKLKYAYASTPDGLGSWTVATIADAKGYDEVHGNHVSLSVVEGHPAISYSMIKDGVAYVRASDPAGATWGAPVVISKYGKFPSMTIVDGHPAIAFQRVSYSPQPSGSARQRNLGVYYVRADDPTGAAWARPVNVGGIWADHMSLGVVAGQPALAYQDRTQPDAGASGLRFVAAKDTTGANWGEPIEIASAPEGGGTCRHPSLVDLGGRAAISYYYSTGGFNGGDLRFAILPSLSEPTADNDSKE